MLDVRLRKVYKKVRRVLDPGIKWWKLKGNEQAFFVDKLIKEANWKDEFVDNVFYVYPTF